MFGYYALFETNSNEPPVGLIVLERSTGPLRAVLWNHLANAWTFSPDLAAPILYDDRNWDRRERVDRSTAEEIALSLGTELPSEEELHRICEEGEQRARQSADGGVSQDGVPSSELRRDVRDGSNDLAGDRSDSRRGVPGPLRAMIWSHRQRAWMFNPTAAAPFLMDDQRRDQQTEVPRSKAEQIARTLGTQVPSERRCARCATRARQGG